MFPVCLNLVSRDSLCALCLYSLGGRYVPWNNQIELELEIKVARNKCGALIDAAFMVTMVSEIFYKTILLLLTDRISKTQPGEQIVPYDGVIEVDVEMPGTNRKRV